MDKYQLTVWYPPEKDPETVMEHWYAWKQKKNWSFQPAHCLSLVCCSTADKSFSFSFVFLVYRQSIDLSQVYVIHVSIYIYGCHSYPVASCIFLIAYFGAKLNTNGNKASPCFKPLLMVLGASYNCHSFIMFKGMVICQQGFQIHFHSALKTTIQQITLIPLNLASTRCSFHHWLSIQKQDDQCIWIYCRTSGEMCLRTLLGVWY